MEQEETLNPTQMDVIRELLSVGNAPVTQDLLTEMCNRRGVPVIPLSEYSSWVYQKEYSERLNTLWPLFLAKLSELRAVSDLMSVAECEAIRARNDEIEQELARYLVDVGAQYRSGGTNEIDLLCLNIGRIVGSAIDGTRNRANNSAAQAVDRIAREKLGDPLTLKALISYLESKA